jgi:hypothetical protein
VLQVHQQPVHQQERPQLLHVILEVAISAKVQLTGGVVVRGQLQLVYTTREAEYQWRCEVEAVGRAIIDQPRNMPLSSKACHLGLL